MEQKCVPGLTSCGIIIAGASHWGSTGKKKAPGWRYYEQVIISRDDMPNQPGFQIVVGLVDTDQYEIMQRFSDEHRTLSFYSWLEYLAPAVNNVYIYGEAPMEYKNAALTLPGIECLGLSHPDPNLISKVANLSRNLIFNISLYDLYHQPICRHIIVALSKLNVARMDILCKGFPHSDVCGFLSLFGSEECAFKLAKFCFSITSISCRHLLRSPYKRIFLMMTRLRRLEIFRCSVVNQILSALLPPLEVELREENSNPDVAARIGPAVTVFESTLEALTKNQIRRLRACVGMKELSVVMKEGYDWELIDTVKSMRRLQRLQILGDDSADDVNLPLIKAAPDAMWYCAKCCLCLKHIYFNTIFIPSREIEMIFHALGRRLESFRFGIWKHEKEPDEKFVDIMLCAAKYCGGRESRLRHLGIPHPGYMNIRKGDVSPITEQRRSAYWNAADEVTSCCPRLQRIGIEKVWDVVLYCERRTDVSAGPSFLRWSNDMEL